MTLGQTLKTAWACTHVGKAIRTQGTVCTKAWRQGGPPQFREPQVGGAAQVKWSEAHEERSAQARVSRTLWAAVTILAATLSDISRCEQKTDRIRLIVQEDQGGVSVGRREGKGAKKATWQVIARIQAKQ